ARIGEEDVEAAELLLDACGERVDVAEIPRVGSHGDGSLAELARRLREPRLVLPRDDHASALVEKALGGLEPDSRRAASDDGRLSVELTHLLPPFFTNR